MHFRAFILNSYVLGALALIVLAGGYWLYIATASPSFGETITIQPQNFTQSIEVSGTVQAAQNVTLGFDQSGRVSAVFAQVGDQAAAGTELAEIENGDLRAAVAQKEAALQAAQAQLASLQSGTRPETIAITQTQIANDQTAVAQAEQAVVNAIENAYTESDDAIHNKVDQFFTNPESANPTIGFSTSNSQLQTTLENERVAVEPMLGQWHNDASSLSASSTDLSTVQSEAQSDLAQVSQLLSDANTALNDGIPSQQASQSTLNSYIALVSTARSNVNAAQSTLTSAISSLQTAQAALAEDQKNLALQQAGSTQDDIAAQEAQVAEAQADLQNAQAQLAQTIVVAPFSGTVTQMDAKVGEIVSPTDSDISMISNGLFQIVCYVPEVEIEGLTVGDNATTTLDAYGSDTYFPASVISIDPAETVVNGVSTYKTTLQFNAADPRIRSGMTANVTIVTSNVADALAVPQGAVFQKGGQPTVQIVQDGKAVDVPVTTGGSSAVGDVQVTSGLQPGDVVILSPDVTQ